MSLIIANDPRQMDDLAAVAKRYGCSIQSLIDEQNAYEARIQGRVFRDQENPDHAGPVCGRCHLEHRGDCF